MASEMYAKVICVVSAKGGSGKTSLTASFCNILSGMGKRVLMIDADMATNGLTFLYLKEVGGHIEQVDGVRQRPRGLFRTLLEEGEQPSIVALTEQLHLLPSDFALAHIDARAVCDLGRRLLAGLITRLRCNYDFIFIDAQAGADEVAQLVMGRDISDEVVIVTEYDPMSAAGVERLKALLPDELQYDRTWVLINKILPEFGERVGEFLEFIRYLSPIPWNAEVVRSYARRQLAVNTDTGTEHTLAVIQTLKGLFGDTLQREINGWVESRAAAIRQPLEIQYSDAETKLKGVLEEEKRIE